MNDTTIDQGPGSVASSPPLGLNRAAMRADTAAALSWLQASEIWTLLDQMVTPLLGRSPLRIASAASSAVTELPAEDLEDLLWFVVDHALGYLGVQAPATSPPPPALAAARAALAGTFSA